MCRPTCTKTRMACRCVHRQPVPAEAPPLLPARCAQKRAWCLLTDPGWLTGNVSHVGQRVGNAANVSLTSCCGRVGHSFPSPASSL